MNKLNRGQIGQAIQYLEWKVGTKLPLKILFALIYLADRYHLRKNGALFIGGHSIPGPEGYAIIDKCLPPINLEVAHHLGLHPEDHDKFLIELNMEEKHVRNTR